MVFCTPLLDHPLQITHVLHGGGAKIVILGGVQNDPFWSLLGLFLTPFLTHYIQDLGGKNGVKRPKRGSQKWVILGVKNDPILVIFGPPQRGPKSGHFGTF